MLETTLSLSSLPGVSGWEDEVRAWIYEKCRPYADAIETDAMGNLFVWKSGRKALDKPLMLCAPMDEVGLIVSGYREDGTLRFESVGEIDRRVLIGKRVELGDARLPGVIGLKAIHLTSKEERAAVPKEEELYIDIGAETEQEARERISLGTRASFLPNAAGFGKGYWMGKAIGERACCAALLEILKETPAVDLCCVFTVQEEVECRGAVIAARRVDPILAVSLGVVCSAEDAPSLGGGLVIPYMDKGVVYPAALRTAALRAAEKYGVKLQESGRILPKNAGGSIQRSGEGVNVLSVLLPVRNPHTPACILSESDAELLPKLIKAIAEEVDNGSFRYGA